MRKTLLAALLAPFIALANAHADVVVLTNGNQLEGKVEHKDNSYVIHFSATASVTLPADQVREIIKKESPLDHFERSINSNDVEILLNLVRYCKLHSLTQEAQHAYERILQIDPEHESARAALGFEKVDGVWLQGEALFKAKGYVKFKGQWVTPEQRAAMIVQAAEEEAKRIRQAAMHEADAVLKAAKKETTVASTDIETRLAELARDLEYLEAAAVPGSRRGGRIVFPAHARPILINDRYVYPNGYFYPTYLSPVYSSSCYSPCYTPCRKPTFGGLSLGFIYDGGKFKIKGGLNNSFDGAQHCGK